MNCWLQQGHLTTNSSVLGKGPKIYMRERKVFDHTLPISPPLTLSLVFLFNKKIKVLGFSSLKIDFSQERNSGKYHTSEF